MLTLEQCTRRCFTLLFENYGSCRRLNCPNCVAAETRAKRRRADAAAHRRRHREGKPAEVSRNSRAA